MNVQRIGCGLVAACGTFALAGCGTISDAILGHARTFTSAPPLAIPDESFGATGAAGRTALAKGINQSLAGCSDFLTKVYVGEGSFNTASDAGGAVLTGVATVISPINAIHGLAAAATVVTTTRSSVNNEFFSKASGTTLQLAVAKTYYADMDHLLDEVKGEQDTAFPTAYYLNRLQSIHGECSLNQAATAVAATFAAAAASSASSPSAPAAPVVTPVPVPAPVPAPDVKAGGDGKPAPKPGADAGQPAAGQKPPDREATVKPGKPNLVPPAGDIVQQPQQQVDAKPLQKAYHLPGGSIF